MNWSLRHFGRRAGNVLITTTVVFAVSIWMSATTRASADDLVLADFEGATYGTWKATGEAFGPGPARGTLPGQMHVEGYQGKWLVNSFFKGDGTTGTLTSPEFKIERKFIGFLIGGGKDAEKLSLKLLIDTKVVRHATGPNDKPGGSESLAPEAWDVGPSKPRGIVEVLTNSGREVALSS